MKPTVPITTLALVLTVLSPAASSAAEPSDAASLERAEAAGTYVTAPKDPTPPAPREGRRFAGGTVPDMLLIGDSSNDRVMSFDPVTGDLIDADFIPTDAVNLATPIHAILGPNADTILVSDQIRDVVQEFDLAGNFLGTFAPAGGVDTTILDNVRGISLRANGNLLVTVASGSNADAVAEFDTSGTYLGNFVANGSGGLASPFDILLADDALVGAINSDAIHRYDVSTGAYIADLAAVNSFPEQLAMASNGNLLVANFSGTQEGILELQPDGTLVDLYNPPGSGGNFRGVYELPNGNLLVTNSGGVHEISRDNVLIETKYSGDGRFIELIEGAVPVELQSFSVE